MENTNPPNIAKESNKGLQVPAIIIAFLACAWLVYAYANKNWFDAFTQVAAGLMHPTITYTPVSIVGFPWAVLATVEVLFVGVMSAHLLLGKEKDFALKAVTAIGMGFGLTGLVVIVLGVLGDLYVFPLNLTLLLLGVASFVAIFYFKKSKEKQSIRHILSSSFHLNFKMPPNPKLWVPAVIAVAIIFFFSFYHALLTVVVHWDATVYHAVMPVIMYNEHSIPVIAGPSIGIEMSANFPPLFSALGAFYYIQINAVEDFFLRAIPPVMGLLAVFATYKIGEVVLSKKFGVVAALFLAVTPIFFRYSIYATSYSTLTFFSTVAILFLMLGLTKENNRYWVVSGVFFGFAALTSYIALYLAPFFILALLYKLFLRKGTFKINLKKAALFLVAALIIGGVWYVRNEVSVGNPIYPNAYTVLGGVNIDPLIMNTTVNGIKLSAFTSYFGAANTTLFDQFMIFLTYRTSFPAISLLTVLAIALLPFENKRFWLLAVWPLSLSFFVFSGISWGFPRHLVFAIPGFALLSALPIVKVLDICKTWDNSEAQNRLRQVKRRLIFIKKTNFLRLGIVVILSVAFLFPSLTLVIGGKLGEENLADQVSVDYLWFIEHPNAETWTVLNRLYPEAVAWEYINVNLTVGQKVGTVENRIYYVKNCSNDYFFYLDGWEARDLYNITDPTLMVQFLRSQNVSIIVDVIWAREHGHFDLLPMTKYLGVPSPFFPTIFNNDSNPAIFNVGPFKSPITDNSTNLVSISQSGWGQQKIVNGVKTQAVIANNDSAKLFVATPCLTSVNITYLDKGNDAASVNLHDLQTQNWTKDYTVIERNNTGLWRSCQFLVPPGEEGYVELGLHAFGEDFTVSQIEVAPYQPLERTVVNSANYSLNITLTNTTLPETLMIYLPIENQTKNVQVQTNSYGKQVGIEVFEGIIQPWENTDWWSRHNLITRSPNSIVKGVLDPSLVWQPENSGYYTLVFVLRQYWAEDSRMNVTITMEAQKNSTNLSR